MVLGYIITLLSPDCIRKSWYRPWWMIMAVFSCLRSSVFTLSNLSSNKRLRESPFYLASRYTCQFSEADKNLRCWWRLLLCWLHRKRSDPFFDMNKPISLANSVMAAHWWPLLISGRFCSWRNSWRFAQLGTVHCKEVEFRQRLVQFRSLIMFSVQVDHPTCPVLLLKWRRNWIRALRIGWELFLPLANRC